VQVFLFGLGGSSEGPWGQFPGGESSAVVSEGNSTSYRVTFGRDLHVFGRDDRVAVGNDDAFSVRVYDPSGTLLHVVRLAVPSKQVTAADFDRVLDELLDRVEAEPFRERIRAGFEQMPRHGTLPAYASIRLDEQRRLWVEESQLPWDQGPVLWYVFDENGELQRSVEMPESLTVLDIAYGFVSGVIRDELGTERVRLYRLE
jgi:hypothetical protein